MDSEINIDDILNGVANSEFELRFNPQLDLASGRICALEGNLIWVKMRYETLTKAHILNILGRHNKRVSFFLYYLVQALRAQLHFKHIGYPLRLSISLRPSELNSPRFFQAVDRVFRECGASAHGITLELPSTILDDFYEHIGTISRLIDYGFHISVRDFYQDPDTLSKVSRDLIGEIKTPAALSRKILDSARASLNLQKLLCGADRLGWSCVVDGVDDRNCLEGVKNLGGHILQGHYMGDNLNLDDTSELLMQLEL
ncbi:EAL domain-containing protein [Spongiibacter sp.]|uniref:EAL domain-containing protein n=1 Tax=Spongiibacter sp. TaxID=2024860 RepID=UPI003569BBBC